MNDALAVSWGAHRRTKELCAGLNIDLFVFSGRKARGSLRYLILGVRTLTLLVRRRPDVLFVQNPSLVLAMLAVALRRPFGYRLIIDAHNEAVVPFINRQVWVARLSRWVIRGANITIVSNRHLAEHVTQQGGTPFILPDRIPVPPAVPERQLAGTFSVVLVATFAPDEPIRAIFEAVQGIEIELYVTGDYKTLDRCLLANVPKNVRFTGYLEEVDYWTLLRSADAIIDLTLMDNCLVCGAYEALALGKPMLLSSNSACVELFSDCAVFTNNSPEDIRAALGRLRLERAHLQAAAERMRREFASLWAERVRALADLIDYRSVRAV